MLFAFHRVYVRAHLYTVVHLLYNIQWWQMRISTVVHTFMCATHTHTHTHTHIYIYICIYMCKSTHWLFKRKREKTHKRTLATWCIPRDIHHVTRTVLRDSATIHSAQTFSCYPGNHFPGSRAKYITVVAADEAVSNYRSWDRTPWLKWRPLSFTLQSHIFPMSAAIAAWGA